MMEKVKHFALQRDTSDLSISPKNSAHHDLFLDWLIGA